MRIVLLLNCCLLGLLVQAQNEQSRQQFYEDSVLAVRYFNIADTSYYNAEKCIRYSNLALPLLQRTQQWEKLIYVKAGLSYCYNILERYDSLEINNREAFELAKIHLPEESYLRMATLNNLAMVYNVVYQDYGRALELYKAALIVYEKENSNPIFQGNILKNIGRLLVRKGDFSQGRIYLQDALNIYRLGIAQDNIYNASNLAFRVAEGYQDLAKVARYQQDFDAAKRYLQDMLHLMDDNTPTFASSYYVYAYTQLAEVLIGEGATNEAQAFITRAFRLPKLTLDQKAEIFELQSQAFAKQGAWLEASTAVKKAIEKASPEKVVDIAERQGLQARYLAASGKLQGALSAVNSGLVSLTKSGTIEQLLQLPVTEWDLLSPLSGIQLLKERAVILQEIALAAGDVSYTRAALESYRLLSNLGDGLRRDYQSEESKLFLGANAHDFYETAIELAYQTYQQTQQPSYLEDVFFFFERSKAAVLLEELRAQEAEGLSAVPEEVLEKGQALKVEINYYRKLISAEKARGRDVDQKKLDVWNSELLSLTRMREEWEEALAADYPEYQTYTQPRHLTIAQVQAQVPTGEGIISYFVGKKQWYVLLIHQSRVQVERIAEPLALREQQRILLQNLKLTGGNGIHQFADAAHQLYQGLLGAFPLEELERLVLIPDGQLAFLPFDLLLSEPAEGRHLRTFPYLFRDYAIRFAYSWAVLQLQEEEAMAVEQLLYVAPVFAGRQGLQLDQTTKPPASADEWQPVNLSDSMATRDNFSRLAHQYHILHFASHATAYDSIFGQPAIDFFDAPLHLRDLYSMRLSAHLVVLSACEAGIGDVERGEGMMSLARGFAYAGVPSVVSTLWRVNEAATQDLVERFYHHLSNGERKDNALRLAKLDFLEHCADIQLAPYYWAGLVAIGDGRSIVVQRVSLWWGLGLLLVLAFLTLLYLRQ